MRAMIFSQEVLKRAPNAVGKTSPLELIAMAHRINATLINLTQHGYSASRSFEQDVTEELAIVLYLNEAITKQDIARVISKNIRHSRDLKVQDLVFDCMP